MIFKTYCSFLILLLPLIAISQDSIHNESKGKLTGQWRSYYMNTYNKGQLKDFHALATGGHLKYSYEFSFEFSVTGAAYTSVNTGIQDLTTPDIITGKRSRYNRTVPARKILAYKLEEYLQHF